tara:strand:+ start:596 stop:1996 length:1401 start_codon:yes stop_codon:yes gene_type:complete
MSEGCILEDNIEKSTTSNEEHDLYVHACIYYNYNDSENSVDRLIKLYEEYSKTDADLFSYAAYNVMQGDVNSSLLRKICEMHCNIKSEYSNEHLELLNRGVFAYIQNSKEDNRIVPDCIISTLGDLLDVKIIDYINSHSDIIDTKKYISTSLDYESIRNKNVVNCYYNKSSCGIGDFLRGSCYLFDLLNNKDVSFNVSLSNHDVGNYVTTTFDEESTVLFDVERIYDTEKTNKVLCSPSNYIQNMKNNLIQKVNNSKDDNIFLFCSYSNFIDVNNDVSNISITKDCQKFMQDNLIYSDEVIQQGDKLIKSLNDFTVIHFRLGDFMMLKDKAINIGSNDDINTKKYPIDFETIKKTIKDTHEITGKDIVIMSDSNEVKEYIQQESLQGIHVVHNNSQHCSDNPGQLNNIVMDKKEKVSNMFYVALDMYIMSKSTHMYSYSVYPWGSGFCFWISKIYNIPIESFMIND